MSNYNIDKYRKKVNRKQFARRILSSIIFFLVIIGLICLGYFYFKEKELDAEKDRTFPISLKGETVYDINETDGNLIITAQANNIYLRLDPIKQSSLQHGFSSPIVVTKDKYILTYDLGGYELTLGIRNKNPENLKMTTQILFCEMNGNGDIAVVTSGEHSANTVTIFDKNLKQILKYDVDDYIMALDFTRNGCVFAAQNAVAGSYVTNVYQLNYQKEKVEWKTTVPGMITYDLDVKEDRTVQLIGNGQSVTLSSTGENLRTETFYGSIAQISHYDDITVLALKNAMNPNFTDLQIFSADGKSNKVITVDSAVLDIFCDERGILFLEKNRVRSYSYELEEISSVAYEGVYTNVVRVDETVYIMGNDEIACLESDN